MGLNPLTESPLCWTDLSAVKESVAALKQVYCWLASEQCSHWCTTVPGALSYLRAVLQTDPTPLIRKKGVERKKGERERGREMVPLNIREREAGSVFESRLLSPG